MRQGLLLRMAALVILGALALAASGCGGRKTITGEGGVVMEVPSDAPKDAKASLVTDRSWLPSPDSGASLLSTAHFEPEGALFPKGVKVTWPLGSKQSPGAALWIVEMDRDGRCWRGTGERAVVAKSGDLATGMIYHFSDYGVQPQEPVKQTDSGKPLPSPSPDPFTKYPGENITVPRVKIVEYEAGIIDIAKQNAARTACEELNAKVGAGGTMTRDDFKKFVNAVDHPAATWAIQEGALSERASHLLADWRILVRLEAAGKFLESKSGRALRLHRSDTGGQANGYLHDMDESYYVQERVGDEWVRRPDMDMELGHFIEGRLEKEGLSNSRMKVSTMPGSYRFPDDRVVIGDLHGSRMGSPSGMTPQMQVEFAHEALKRKGVYCLPGPVGQFMAERVERQAYQAFEMEAPVEPREILLPELKQKIKRLSNQVDLILEKPADNPVAPAEWRPGTYDDVHDVILTGLDRKKTPGWAYDMATVGFCEVSDHIEDMKDPKKVPPVSQILRSVCQGPGLIAVIEERSCPVNYERLAGDGPKRDFLRRIYGDDILKPSDFKTNGPAGMSLLERWKTVLDICAEIRRRQSNPSVPLTEGELAVIFKPLADQVAPGYTGDRDELMKRVRIEFINRVNEITMRNVVQTCRERMLEWVSCETGRKNLKEEMLRHIDVDELRRAYAAEKIKPGYGPTFDRVLNDVKRVHQVKAYRSLIYSFRNMSKEMVDAVIRHMDKMPELNAVDKAIIRHWSDAARKPYLGLDMYLQYPELLKLDLKKVGVRMADISRSIMDHIAHQIGWIDTSGGQYVPNPLTDWSYGKIGEDFFFSDLHKLDRRTQGFFQKNNTILGRGARFLHTMVWDPGTLDAVTQVLVAYSESRGDPEVLENAVTEQIVSNIPFVGQVIGFVRADSIKERAKMVGILVAAYYIPGLQHAMAMYGVAEGGVFIYYTDYRMPLANAAADACYRGFVGPTLYEFDGVPAQFSDADEALHGRLVDDLEHVKITKENAKDVTQKMGRLQDLEDKRLRWKGYVIEQSRYEGGVLTGTGAHYSQKLLDLPKDEGFVGDDPLHMAGPMLARVKPYVLFTGRQGGTVKFYLSELTPSEKDRLNSLQGMIDKEEDPVHKLELAYELDELHVHQMEWERAQHYLVAAGFKAPGPNDVNVKVLPELAHQIRVDSLYPYIINDPTKDMLNPAGFVRLWFGFRSRTLPPALAKVGVKFAEGSTLNTLVMDTKAEITDRLLKDIETSKQRWIKLKSDEEAIRKGIGKFSERGKTRVDLEGVMVAVERGYSEFSDETNNYFKEAKLDPKLASGLGRIGEAISNRNRPLSPPEVRFDALFIKGDPQATEESKRKHVFRPMVTVVADPVVYGQPWSYSFYQLDRGTVKQAVAAKEYRGLPLDDRMIRKLKGYLDAIPEPNKGETCSPAFLVFAWCHEAKVPDRVVAWTGKGIPKLQARDVPDGKGQAYLFGGAAFWADLEPTVESGKLKLATRRSTASGVTDLVVISESVAKLDTAPRTQRLRFNLYASLSEQGPWETLEKGIEIGPQIDKDPSSGRILSYRTSKDHAVFGDRGIDDLAHKKQWPANSPRYYRVGEQWASTDGPTGKTTLSKEVSSNVAGPGAPRIVIRGRQSQELDNETRLQIARGGGTMMNVGLGFENETIELPGAHITVKEGNRTYHCWTNRREGDYYIGSPRDGSGLIPRSDGRASYNLVVSAELGSWSASRKVSVVAPEDVVPPAEIERRKAAVDADIASKIRDDRQFNSVSKTALMQAEQRMAMCPKVLTNFRDAQSWYELGEKLIGMRADYAIQTTCREPMRELQRRVQRASIDFDYDQAIGIVRQGLGLAMKEQEIRYAAETQQRATRVQLYQLPGAPGGQLQDALKKQRETEDAHKKNPFKWVGAYEHLTAGKLVGLGLISRDATAFRQGTYLQVLNLTVGKTDDTKSTRDKFLSTLLQQFAEGWVRLTGNQAEAMVFYTEGCRLAGEPSPLAGKSKVLPDWWPPLNQKIDPEKDGKLMKQMFTPPPPEKKEENKQPGTPGPGQRP